MRGVIGVIVALFAVTCALLVGVTVLEPLSQTVANDQAVQDSEFIDGDQWTADVRAAVFIYGPLVFLGVMLIWAVAWYHRRERVVRR